ncbi:hypothetical protein Selin_1440 [Desulfurispirillum indicum S5]|uniref:Uncharacterized protein n=1 Tax=Desulfurispirillum indicum (strain ATCC BAA-1389 / DSM 22839 / S5) TaxID=653733 RepID=E6W6T1_DESIS|nr:hypothetical protein [Desulfurispirillum indicum]ADU66174.1 hypothetical protein Selin_1440 [Desulfurispirillum indicum S5]
MEPQEKTIEKLCGVHRRQWSKAMHYFKTQHSEALTDILCRQSRLLAEPGFVANAGKLDASGPEAAMASLLLAIKEFKAEVAKAKFALSRKGPAHPLEVRRNEVMSYIQAENWRSKQKFKYAKIIQHFAYITDLRESGCSWREVAKRLKSKTGLTVSGPYLIGVYNEYLSDKS